MARNGLRLTNVLPNTFSYCNFFGGTLNGAAMNPSAEPVIFGEFNIAWPQGWTSKMAERYRRENGLMPLPE